MSELAQTMCELLLQERRALRDDRLHDRAMLRAERAGLLSSASSRDIEDFNRWLIALESTSAQAA